MAASLGAPPFSTDLAAAEDQPIAQEDSGSAMQSARERGSRVEDLSQRSDFGSVYANPDGTWTAELAPEPVQVQDPASGEWSDVDTTLVDTGHGIMPEAAASDLVLSAGGDQVFAKMTVDGQLIEWRWPSTLPTPVLDGATATYADVSAGQDLVVEATSTGFQHFVVLQSAPAPGFAVRLPIATHGAALSETPQGGVVIEADGEVVVDAAPPVMWDASATGEDEDPTVKAVATGVESQGTARPILTLTPDQDFLADPATVYPVTIDPSFSKYTNGDAWVQNSGYTTGQTSSPELRVGTYDSGTHKARSFIHFDNINSTIAGKYIASASLILRNFESANCSGATIRVGKITQDWSGSSLTWANQPNVGTLDATFYPAKGGGSDCPAGDATWDVTSIVANWAQDPASNNRGLRIKADDETVNRSWRVYRSANYSTQDLRPQLVITYDSIPSAPGQLGATPCTTPCGSYPLVVDTADPVLTATSSDSDGGYLAYAWQVRAQGTTALLASGSTSAPAGTPSTWQVPDGVLSDRVLYEFRVSAADSHSVVWSNWKLFAPAVGWDDPDGETTDADTYSPEEEIYLSPDPADIDQGFDATIPEGSVANWTAVNDTRTQTQVNQLSQAGGLISTFGGTEPPPGGNEIPWSGWAACGAMDSKYKVVHDYDRDTLDSRMQRTYVRLYCGRYDKSATESRFGYRHIKDRHAGDWSNYSWAMGRQWQDLVGWMMDWVAYDPDLVSRWDTPPFSRERFCYQRKFLYVIDDETVWKVRAVMLTGRTAVRILTFFPNSASGSGYCANKGVVIKS